ncbi:Myotubularin-like phosphatase domain [Pelomyxa schiedti]|nr:Myotubularin-like phosphatase domain [Pelomyxa schiedti]
MPGGEVNEFNAEHRTTVRELLLMALYNSPKTMEVPPIHTLGVAIHGPDHDPIWLEDNELIMALELSPNDHLSIGVSPQFSHSSGDNSVPAQPPPLPPPFWVRTSLTVAAVKDWRTMHSSVPTVLEAIIGALGASSHAKFLPTSLELLTERALHISIFNHSATFIPISTPEYHTPWDSFSTELADIDEIEIVFPSSNCMFFLSPSFSVQIVLVELKRKKTLVFDKNTTVGDAVKFIWGVLNSNKPLVHHMKYGLKSSKGIILPRGKPLSSCVPSMWWEESLYFSELPTVEANTLPFGSISTVQENSEVSSTSIYTVILPEYSTYKMVSLQGDQTIQSCINEILKLCPMSDLSPYQNSQLFLTTGSSLELLDSAKPLSFYSSKLNKGLLELHKIPLSNRQALVNGIHSSVYVHTLNSAILERDTTFASNGAGVNGSVVCKTYEKMENLGSLVYGPPTSIESIVAQISQCFPQAYFQSDIYLWGLEVTVSETVKDCPPQHPTTLTLTDPSRSLWFYRLRMQDSIVLPLSSMELARDFAALPGEVILHETENAVRVQPGALLPNGRSSHVTSPGRILLTNYRFTFVNSTTKEMVGIPNQSISGVGLNPGSHIIDVYTKDIRKETFAFSPDHFRMVAQVVGGGLGVVVANPSAFGDKTKVRRRVCFGVKVRECFAYPHELKTPLSNSPSGWHIYNMQSEFARQGYNSLGWRTTLINSDYKVCASYPPILLVPRSVTDLDLVTYAELHTWGRFPLLTWLHSVTGACLIRSSKIANRKRALEENRIVTAIAGCNIKTNSVVVVDSKCTFVTKKKRDKLTASGTTSPLDKDYAPKDKIGEKLLQKGASNVAVRDSFYKLCDMCLSLEATNWAVELARTKWLEHVSRMLNGASLVAHLLSNGTNVHIHGSEGSDRTALVASLAQILVDPYYRTIQGFEVLIEKDWVSFGHRFQERTGFGQMVGIGGVAADNDTYYSPIFLLFIDCVWQIKRQFPREFQFNDAMLVFILDSVNDCRFGTFLCNNEKERQEENVRKQTLSVWGWVNHHAADFTTQDRYAPSQNTLIPCTSPIALTLWIDYYLRYNKRLLFSP